MTHDAAFQRKLAILDGFALSCSIRWMERLPAHIRPIELSRRFPRVLRAIATKWNDVPACRRYLSSLQFDDRRTRQAFPFEIVQEICALRDYLDSQHPPPKDIWWQAFEADKH